MLDFLTVGKDITIFKRNPSRDMLKCRFHVKIFIQQVFQPGLEKFANFHEV
jgi:hypothetical protein